MGLPQRSVQPFRTPADFRFPGQERQDISFLFPVYLPDGLGNRRNRVVGFRYVKDLHGVHLSFAGDGCGVQGTAKRFRIQGRGQDDDFQVRTQQVLDLAGQGEGGIAVETALVEFVKQDGSDAFQGRIFDQHPGQDAFGQDFDAGLPGNPLLETDPVTDGFSDRFPQQE